MRSDLSELGWHKELDGLDADQTWQKFVSLFNEVQAARIPLKTRRQSDQPLWMRPNVLRTIRKKRRLYDYYKSNGSLKSLTKYRAQVNLAQKSVRDAKKVFEEEISQSGISNQKKFYAYMKQKSKSNEGISSLRAKSGELVNDD